MGETRQPSFPRPRARHVHLAVTREKPSVSELRPLRENGLPFCYACYKLALLSLTVVVKVTLCWQVRAREPNQGGDDQTSQASRVIKLHYNVFNRI